MLRLLLALTLLASQAQACESLAINPLPVKPTLNTSRSYANLTALANGAPTFATTQVEYTATLDRCTLDIGYTHVVIYVASEFTQDPCTMRVLVEHEQRHVDAYKVAMGTLSGRLAALLDEHDLDEAASLALGEVERAHKAIDTPQEYKRIATACSAYIVTSVRHMVQP